MSSKCLSQAGDVRRHKKVHTEEKPHECEHCGKCFSKAGNLRCHERHRRKGRGGEGGCSPPKFWETQIFWAARENLGKASF